MTDAPAGRVTREEFESLERDVAPFTGGKPNRVSKVFAHFRRMADALVLQSRTATTRLSRDQRMGLSNREAFELIRAIARDAVPEGWGK